MSSAPTEIATEALEAVHAPAVRTSWAEVDLEPILDGEQLEEGPTQLERSDGSPTMYAGRIHGLHGEPGSAKSWLAAHAGVQRIRAREHVVFVDFEDRAEAVVARHQALGLGADEIAVFFHYVRPDEPLAGRARADLWALLERVSPTLVVIDGMTEVLAMHGLDLNNNTDVAKLIGDLSRPIAARGAAVLQIDHVAKSPEARGRFALGAGHKLAGVDVALSLELVHPFGRGREGLARLIVQKDRPRFLHGLAPNGKLLAEFRMAANDEGSEIVAELRPPDAGPFRPTVLMERVSRYLEAASDDRSKRTIREAVTGRNPGIDRALKCLVEEGFVKLREDGIARRYRSLRVFRDGIVNLVDDGHSP